MIYHMTTRLHCQTISILLACFVAPIWTGCSTGSTTLATVDAEAFSLILQRKDITLVDLRTPEETAEGMIEGATQMDFRDPAFAENLQALPRDKPYAVYCKGGSRSGKALNQMKDLGFKEVYNLAGGYTGWQDLKKQ